MGDWDPKPNKPGKIAKSQKRFGFARREGARRTQRRRHKSLASCSKLYAVLDREGFKLAETDILTTAHIYAMRTKGEVRRVVDGELMFEAI